MYTVCCCKVNPEKYLVSESRSEAAASVLRNAPAATATQAEHGERQQTNRQEHIQKHEAAVERLHVSRRAANGDLKQRRLESKQFPRRAWETHPVLGNQSFQLEFSPSTSEDTRGRMCWLRFNKSKFSRC